MFRVVTSQDDLKKVFEIRTLVFCEEQAVPYEIEIDEYEDTSIHILGEFEGEPVACGRLRFIEDYAKLERLAILKAYRGKGYGSLLLEFLLSVAREKGFNVFKLHAQISSEQFYIKHDFKSVGDEFFEANIAHKVMVKYESI